VKRAVENISIRISVTDVKTRIRELYNIIYRNRNNECRYVSLAETDNQPETDERDNNVPRERCVAESSNSQFKGCTEVIIVGCDTTGSMRNCENYEILKWLSADSSRRARSRSFQVNRIWNDVLCIYSNHIRLIFKRSYECTLN